MLFFTPQNIPLFSLRIVFENKIYISKVWIGHSSKDRQIAHKCLNQNTNPEWLSCDKKLLLQTWAWWQDPLFLTEENRNYPSCHRYVVSPPAPSFLNPWIYYCCSIFSKTPLYLFCLPFPYIFFANILVSFCSLHTLQKTHFFFPNKAIGS